MRGAWGAPCRLLPLLLLLSQRTSVQGSPGPLRCYGVGPLGDLNCSWEPLGDLGAPSTLHLQNQKYLQSSGRQPFGPHRPLVGDRCSRGHL